MALRLAAIDNRTIMGDDNKFSTRKLCDLISWFVRDISRPASSEQSPDYTKAEPF